MRNLLPLLVLAACAPQIDVTRPEDAPTGAILTPSAGALVPSGRLELRGRVADTETDPERLFVVWSLGDEASDVEATWRDVCDGFADAEGSTLCLADIEPGDTRVRMVVTDLAGFRHQEVVTVRVDPIEAPTVDLQQPSGSRWVYADVPFVVRAVVTDADDAPETLEATWQATGLGELDGPARPDETGVLAGTLSLPVGEYQLTLTVTDPDGATGSASVPLEVVVNTPPTARIEQPTVTAVVVGAPVALVGRALDADTLPADLTWSWSSDLDGGLGSGSPPNDGRVRVEDVVLSAGAHVLSFAVTDDAGVTTTATKALKVGEAPEVTWTSPEVDQVFTTTAGVAIAGTASDDETPADALTLTVSSSVQGPVAELHPAEDGTIATRLLGLQPTAHTLTLTVTDADGLTTVSTRRVVVVAP